MFFRTGYISFPPADLSDVASLFASLNDALGQIGAKTNTPQSLNEAFQQFFNQTDFVSNDYVIFLYTCKVDLDRISVELVDSKRGIYLLFSFKFCQLKQAHSPIVPSNVYVEPNLCAAPPAPAPRHKTITEIIIDFFKKWLGKLF